MQDMVVLAQDMVMVVPAQVVLMQLMVVYLQTPLELETVEVEHLLVLLEVLEVHQLTELLYKELFTEITRVVMERRAVLMHQVVVPVLLQMEYLDQLQQLAVMVVRDNK